MRSEIPPRSAARSRRGNGSSMGSRAVVHGDHDVGIEIDEGAQGLFGAGVNGAVAIGEVGADGEQGDLGVKAPADFCEAVEISGVA